MAEESAAAVAESPASIADTAADTAAPDVAPAATEVTSPAEPAAPQRAQPESQRSIEPDATTRTQARPPTRQPARQAEPDPSAERPPLDEARDATDTLLNWRDLADPKYRQSPTLKKYDSVGKALDALVNQEELLGRSIQVPREGAGEVQWRNVYEKLGCPKVAGDYTIRDPDMGQDDEGNARTLAPNFLVSLLDVAHAAGLNNSQAQHFVDFAARTVLNSEQIQAGEMAMHKAQTERELFQAFGGDSATMIQKARLALTKLGEGRYGGGAYAQRAAEKWANSALGNDVDMVAMLANLWDNVSEGNFVESGAGGELSSREQLTADIVALDTTMHDESKPLAEREQAAQAAFRKRQDLVAMDEAATRRQGGFRR
jgi:hypothetical protein